MIEPAIPRRARNAHCSYCGKPFPPDLPWPRRCAGCESISYLNPLPVSVLLLPVDDGLLLVLRAIPPREGLLALPGGYIGMGESWQEAAARELFEETGVRVDPGEIQLFDVQSAPDGTVLIFGLANSRRAEDLPLFVPTEETSGIVVAPGPTELAFPLHTLVAGRFWAQREAQVEG